MTSPIRHLAVIDNALSVGGVTDYIRALLEDDAQLHRVWVTGEVSSVNRHRSGLFFTLQDPDTSAAIDCVIWSSYLAQVAVQPRLGEQIIILGSLRLYAKRGRYNLSVWQALPAGAGLQALRLRQLQQRLAAEGLFDEERKRTLPTYPQTIAVVTSPQAAAWGDIQRTLRQRHPGLTVLLSPAIVQGQQAPASIDAAIARVVQDGRAEVLILARGGGAAEDLACFNDEQVVRAIADCPIPVITGIGHQRDQSLADRVADVCVHTPTAAAEQVVPGLAELQESHRDRADALLSTVQAALRLEQQRLERLRRALRQLQLERQVQHQRDTMAWKQRQLVQAMQTRLVRSQQQCQLLRQKLDDLNPKAVLKRGYALVRDRNQAIVRTAAGVYAGQDLTIQLDKAEIEVTVKSAKSAQATDFVDQTQRKDGAENPR
jgi:exodeoxyribonuclease VII large subunit